jgi:hypothetical protein
MFWPGDSRSASKPDAFIHRATNGPRFQIALNARLGVVPAVPAQFRPCYGQSLLPAALAGRPRQLVS